MYAYGMNEFCLRVSMLYTSSGPIRLSPLKGNNITVWLDDFCYQ